MNRAAKKMAKEFKRRREIRAINAGRRESEDSRRVRVVNRLIRESCFPKAIATQMYYLGIGFGK